MQEKIQILRKAFGSNWSTGTETLFRCPKCDHDKLKMSINIEKDAFKCWVCGYSGKKILSLIKRYAPEYYASWSNITEEIDLSEYEFIFSERRTHPAEPVELPVEFKTLSGPASIVKNKPLKYLRSRGLTDEDILKWRVGFCDYGEYANRVVIPSFTSAGALDYFVARSYSGDWMKYKNPKVSKDIIFNDLNVDWSRDIILVEGVLDAMKCDNAIPLLGSTLREDSQLFQKICKIKPRVYLALDADAKGKEFNIARNLGEYGIKSMSISISPYDDIGEMPRSLILERKQNADIVSDLDYLHYKLDF